MEEKKGKRTEAGSCDEVRGSGFWLLVSSGKQEVRSSVPSDGEAGVGNLSRRKMWNGPPGKSGESKDWGDAVGLLFSVKDPREDESLGSGWEHMAMSADRGEVQTEDWASHTELTARRSWTSDLWARLLIQGTTRIRVPNPPHGVNNLFFSEDQGRCLTPWARKILLMLYFSHQNRCVAPAPF